VLLGTGTMACVMAGDAELTSLAIMVAAGILGGVASKNAALPRLATAQICLGTLPIGIGALLAPRVGYWILAPPLFLYVGAMTSIVRRHYAALVALMTAEQNHAELATCFDAAIAHMPHGLCTIDETGKVIVANRRTADLFRVPHDALRLDVSFPTFIGHLKPTNAGSTRRAQLVERCTAWLAGECSPLDLKLDDGRQLEMTRNPVPDGSTIVILEDVTERRRSEARILHWARHDPLTGLPNRRDVRLQLERLLSQHAGEDNPGIALMYLDLDGFKSVNDSLGHYAGDEVLKIVADRLRGAFRRGQSVGRLGGDELAIVVENAGRHAWAALAKRIIGRLSDPYTLSTGAQAHIGASAGIAFALKDESFEILMKCADTALYAAKAAGKGTFRFAVIDATGIESVPQ
jgi:diguanylate cyclase (GGDEF)-like protein